MAEVGFLTSAASALLELLDTRLTSVSKRVRKGTPGLPVGSWDEAREAVRSAERGHVGDLSLMELEGALRGMALLAGFEELEARLFAFALLPGLDERLGRAVGLVHDDLSRTRISVGLAARALGSLEGRRAVLLAAGPAGRLVGSGLCQLVGAYGDALAPRASQELSPHPRALDALLWGEPLPLPDPALGAAFLVEPPWPTGGAPSRFGSGVDPSAAMSGGAAGLVIASPQIDAAIEVASHFAGVDGLRLVREIGRAHV